MARLAEVVPGAASWESSALALGKGRSSKSLFPFENSPCNQRHRARMRSRFLWSGLTSEAFVLKSKAKIKDEPSERSCRLLWKRRTTANNFSLQRSYREQRQNLFSSVTQIFVSDLLFYLTQKTFSLCIQIIPFVEILVSPTGFDVRKWSNYQKKNPNNNTFCKSTIAQKIDLARVQS